VRFLPKSAGSHPDTFPDALHVSPVCLGTCDFICFINICIIINCLVFFFCFVFCFFVVVVVVVFLAYTYLFGNLVIQSIFLLDCQHSSNFLLISCWSAIFRDRFRNSEGESIKKIEWNLEGAEVSKDMENLKNSENLNP